MTVGQLIRGLKKYHKHLDVTQGGVKIKAMRIWDMSPDPGCTRISVRLIREDEKRA